MCHQQSFLLTWDFFERRRAFPQCDGLTARWLACSYFISNKSPEAMHHWPCTVLSNWNAIFRPCDGWHILWYWSTLGGHRGTKLNHAASQSVSLSLITTTNQLGVPSAKLCCRKHQRPCSLSIEFNELMTVQCHCKYMGVISALSRPTNEKAVPYHRIPIMWLKSSLQIFLGTVALKGPRNNILLAKFCIETGSLYCPVVNAKWIFDNVAGNSK